MLNRQVLCGLATLFYIAGSTAPVSLRLQSPGPCRGIEATHIVLLGTGNPAPDPNRSGPSVAIVANGTPYLVDMGPGVVRRVAAASLKGIRGLESTNIKHVFVTHLHSDHTLGYPDLIFTPWVMERSEPLNVYGPKGLAAMTKHLLKAYREDIKVRTEGLEKANKTGYKVVVHEIQPGLVYKDENVVVRAFPVKHGSWHQAFGYRFETSDKTIVISGDTRPTETVVANCNGCDVLIHEVYPESGFAGISLDRQKYHRSFHTSAIELATIATQAKPRLLVLYHQLLFWGSEEEILGELRANYKGEVVSGHDLDVY
jgi:ribonuclease BN (tRNA processing enzyme)